jgi:hypothetical protein
VATRYETTQLVIPANTSKSAPVAATLYNERAAIDAIWVLVPPGPSGLVGFSFWHSSRQVIPKVDGTWIVADGETVPIQVADLSPWPDWTIHGYNLDTYPHTLYVRLALDDNVTTVPDNPPFLTIE